MSPREALNLAWHYLTKDGTKKGIDKLKADLIKPLPGRTEEISAEAVQAERDMFAKSFASFGEKKQGKGK
jgi:hypothetical protein